MMLAREALASRLGGTLSGGIEKPNNKIPLGDDTFSLPQFQPFPHENSHTPLSFPPSQSLLL